MSQLLSSFSLYIVISPLAPEHRKSTAQALANTHNYAIVPEGTRLENGYVLYFGEAGVELRPQGKGASGPISASFIGGKNAHRMKFGGGKGQLISKAVGVSGGVTPDVLDATAGLGRDAFVLATLGCRVDMFERVPVVEALLADALESAAELGDEQVQQIVARMKLRTGDAINWLRQQCAPVADVIYLDPMYPVRDKSAAVKKEMRAFHDLVGANGDDSDLLNAALDKARFRVVVKRPRKGLKIEGPEPQLQLMGKSSRYDVYTIQSLSQLKQSSS